MTPVFQKELTFKSNFLSFCGPQVKTKTRRLLLTSIQVNLPTPLAALRSLLQDFFEQHPRLTVQALATRANVPVTSLRRIMQEGTKSEVAPHTALNLCSYIMREKNMHKLLQLLPEVLKEYLERHFGAFVFSGVEKRSYSIQLNELLKDRINYFIYKLASNRCGTSWIEITDLFGQVGKKHTDELIAIGALCEQDGIIRAKDSDFSLDLETASSHLPELTKLYKPDQVGRGLNLMYSLSESLNEEAIQKIKDIQREAVKATHAIMQDPTSNGDISYFTINLCESFLSQEQAQGTLQ